MLNPTVLSKPHPNLNSGNCDDSFQSVLTLKKTSTNGGEINLFVKDESVDPEYDAIETGINKEKFDGVKISKPSQLEENHSFTDGSRQFKVFEGVKEKINYTMDFDEPQEQNKVGHLSNEEFCEFDFPFLQNKDADMIFNVNDNDESIVLQCFPCHKTFPDFVQIKLHLEFLHRDIDPMTNIECTICGIILFCPDECEGHLKQMHSKSSSSLNEESNFSFESFLSAIIFLNKLYQYDLKINETEGISSNSTQIPSENKLSPGNFRIVSVHSAFQCEYCDDFYSSSTKLQQHYTQWHNNPERPYECFHCDIVLKDFNAAKIHWENECSYTKNDAKKKLWKDEIIIKEYLCNACETGFAKREDLLEHRFKFIHFFFRVNSDIQICCDLCGNFFNSINILLRHSRSSHKRNYAKTKIANSTLHCQFCGKLYKKASYIYQHLRFHFGIKKFKCTFENCGAGFVINSDLEDHKRKRHTKERAFKCSICSKTFLTGPIYYQHRLTHDNHGRFACTECDKPFKRREALKCHMRIHNDERPYKCTKCERAFRQKGDVIKHERAVH